MLIDKGKMKSKEKKTAQRFCIYQVIARGIHHDGNSIFAIVVFGIRWKWQTVPDFEIGVRLRRMVKILTNGDIKIEEKLADLLPKNTYFIPFKPGGYD